MDPNLIDQSQEAPERNPQEPLRRKTPDSAERKPQRKKNARKLHIAIPIPAFLSRIGEDVRWYYDIRLWSPVILILLILAMCSGRAPKAAPAETVPPVETAPVIFREETVAPTEPIDPEAEALAILADSVGEGRSKNAKIAIMWVAINRSEDRANGYGKSLLEEIARADQWQNYNPQKDYYPYTYELAKGVLETRDNGDLRPLDNDMLWLVLNDNGSVTVRNYFKGKGNEKTIS